MNNRVIFVIADADFNETELEVTKKVIEENGIKVEIANQSGQPSVGMYGKIVKPDIRIDQINPDEYDGIIFIGGPGAKQYFNNNMVFELIKDFYNSGKIVAAICIAPSILANSGILIGKKATAWPSERENINGVGIYTGANIEVDGNIVTANGPESAGEFGRTISNMLKKNEKI